MKMFGYGLITGLVVVGTAVSGYQRGTATQVASDHAAVELLMAKDQIREQIYNYCRGLDRMDKPLSLAVWHPGATVNFAGNFTGTGPEWIERVWVGHARIHSHAHQMTNIIMKVNGDKATSETYFIVSLHAQPTETSASTRLIRGRYADRWSRLNGKWAIDHREILVDFETTETSSGPNPKAPGRRDRTDSSYGYL